MSGPVNIEIVMDGTGKQGRVVIEGIDVTGAVRSVQFSAGVGRATVVHLELNAEITTLDQGVANRFRILQLLHVRDRLIDQASKTKPVWSKLQDLLR